MKSNSEDIGTTPRTGTSPRKIACWLAAFFFTVLGAHCWVVWLYGSALPFWDQWDEAVSLFKPWMEGRLTFGQMAAPDSDHRIVVTHLWDMFLIKLNGRWDPLLQMTGNAFFHVTYACGLAFCLWHFMGRKNAWLICGLLLPFFTLPFAGENAIWGLNSLWYFIHIFGLVCIVGMGFCRAGSWPWWCGLAAALLGLLTMAMGPIPPLATGGLILLRGIKDRRFTASTLIPLVVCILISVVGFGISVRNGYNPLSAHSMAEFFNALVRHLAWPFYTWLWMAFVILLPLVVLLIYYFRVGFQATREAEFLLTLALWSILQSVLLAFGRANYGDVPASRYTEVFCLLLIASIFAAIVLCEQWQRDGILKFNALLLPMIYAGIIVWGLCQMSVIVVDNLLVPTRTMNLIAEERMAAFMASGNENDLLERPTIRPDPKVALSVLQDPKLQPILPVSCLRPASGARDGWLTAPSRWLLRHSVAIMAVGLAIFIGLCSLGLARGTMDLSLKKLDGILILCAAVAALGYVLANHSLQRGSVECVMQQQLADFFKSEGKTNRAAYHAQLAAELKPGK